MNTKPRRSSFGHSDQLALLDAMGTARDRVTRLCAAVSPSSERYRLSSAVLRAGGRSCCRPHWGPDILPQQAAWVACEGGVRALSYAQIDS